MSVAQLQLQLPMQVRGWMRVRAWVRARGRRGGEGGVPQCRPTHLVVNHDITFQLGRHWETVVELVGVQTVFQRTLHPLEHLISSSDVQKRLLVVVTEIFFRESSGYGLLQLEGLAHSPGAEKECRMWGGPAVGMDARKPERRCGWHGTGASRAHI